ncbi:hypothetical protein PHSY_002057 [Pseudozyma hubeiensis SY62]|uniref:Uncharacterized protein n=1 Tax=Pseudozyma hubeiensis (strain SY62) TaxID=1305764 RepID=R9P8S2_PSEHS|nr:hypothetical protein PHSY_002057 [Pseudozyma hubeiensis SY62]GAC94485.1 hypothetical protein PHSY_002057 [Pseudozyma hubeiensis SY62]
MNASQTLDSQLLDFLLLETNGSSKRPASAMSSISERNDRQRHSGGDGSDKDEGCLLVGQQPYTERVEPLGNYETSPTPLVPHLGAKGHRSTDDHDSPQPRDTEIEIELNTEDLSCQTGKNFIEFVSTPYSSATSAIRSSEQEPGITNPTAAVLPDEGKHEDASGPEMAPKAPTTVLRNAETRQPLLPVYLFLWCRFRAQKEDICPAEVIQDIPDPEHSDMQNPLTTKWQILGPKPKPSDHSSVKAQVRQQFEQLGIPNVRESDVRILPNTGRGTYIVIAFDSETKFNHAIHLESIWLGDVKCKLIAGFPRWTADYTILKSDGHCSNVNHESLMNSICDVVKRAVEPVFFLIKMSQTQTLNADGTVTLGESKFAGTVWILGKLIPGRSLSQLPAFVSSPGTPVAPLFFHGRGHACSKCPSAIPPHRPADCPKRVCSNCHRIEALALQAVLKAVELADSRKTED